MHLYVMEYYSSIKKDKPELFVGKRMHPENNVKWNASDTQV